MISFSNFGTVRGGVLNQAIWWGRGDRGSILLLLLRGEENYFWP